MHRNWIEKLNGHKSGVVWFTGLPGSGKTTIALEAEKMLLEQGIRCVLLDGDRLRKGLNRDLGFSEEQRMENIRRSAEVAHMFIEAGVLVLAPLISPTESCREIVRQRFRPEEYTELYVRCSLAECERRDPKGMYLLARAGKIAEFTGITAPYDPPAEPDLVLDTELLDVRQCADRLIGFLQPKIRLEALEEGTK